MIELSDELKLGGQKEFDPKKVDWYLNQIKSMETRDYLYGKKMNIVGPPYEVWKELSNYEFHILQLYIVGSWVVTNSKVKVYLGERLPERIVGAQPNLELHFEGIVCPEESDDIAD